MKEYKISDRQLNQYVHYLKEQERTEATIQKYVRDITALREFLRDGIFTKTRLLEWKEKLIATYALATVNGMLMSVNGFLNFCGMRECRIKSLKIQRNVFCRKEKELTKEEYLRLCHAAKRQGRERLLLILQTICSTGIRVSELPFITAAAVKSGQAQVRLKGKIRTVLLPKQLCRLLKPYMQRQHITDGSIFVTRSGKPVDRSNIWSDMKKLCALAGVEPEKVFPHNLRHLFARTYYSQQKDIVRLADILGHSSVDTTRIYTVECGDIHRRQLQKLGLLLC